MSAAEQTALLQGRLREVFDAHHAFVWRSARRLGVSMLDVDDVVQETFIVVARRIEDFEGRSSMRTWLFAIVANVSHTYRRSDARRLRKAQAVQAVSSASTDATAQSDAVDLVHKLAADLQDDQRTAWILTDLEGMTAREIADELGVNVNTVYSRVRTARKQIEAQLAAITENEGVQWGR